MLARLGGAQRSLMRVVSNNLLKLEKKFNVELNLILEQEKIVVPKIQNISIVWILFENSAKEFLA